MEKNTVIDIILSTQGPWKTTETKGSPEFFQKNKMENEAGVLWLSKITRLLDGKHLSFWVLTEKDHDLMFAPHFFTLPLPQYIRCKNLEQNSIIFPEQFNLTPMFPLAHHTPERFMETLCKGVRSNEQWKNLEKEFLFYAIQKFHSTDRSVFFNNGSVMGWDNTLVYPGSKKADHLRHIWKSSVETPFRYAEKTGKIETPEYIYIHLETTAHGKLQQLKSIDP